MPQPINQSRPNPAAQQQRRRVFAQPHTLTRYKHSAIHDGLIGQAYWKMVEEGVVFDMIPDGSLSGLFIAIHPPSTTYFAVDTSQQVNFLAWFEPNQVFGQLMALWISKEARHSKVSLKLLVEVTERGLNDYHEIIAVTSNHNVIEGAPELGYDVVGVLKATEKRAEKWILQLSRRMNSAR